MPSVEKILLPVDFSEQCPCATRDAAALARHFDAELTLVYVEDPAVQTNFCLTALGASVWRAFRRSCTSNIRRRLQEFESETLRDLRVKRVMPRGKDPGQAIVDVARRDLSDLIVLPTCTSGKRALASVTEAVLREAGCPVWSSKHDQGASKRDCGSIRNILCAVDRDERAPAVLGWARDFASRFSAALTVVHAVPPDGQGYDSLRLAGLRREREVLQRKLSGAGLRAGIHVETGEVASVVVTAEEELNADLLAIGRTQDTHFLGHPAANSYALIGRSVCPVVSV
jgi:nucleotide-binding universal stress UspA family protein